MSKRPFNGSPTVDGYYTTFDSSEVHRVEEPSDGGSGSGNLTIAKLVVKNGGNVRFNGPFIGVIPEAGINGAISSSYGSSSPFSVILYNGKAYLDIVDIPAEVSLEGNIAHDSDSGLYVVTGDCTITFPLV